MLFHKMHPSHSLIIWKSLRSVFDVHLIVKKCEMLQPQIVCIHKRNFYVQFFLSFRLWIIKWRQMLQSAVSVLNLFVYREQIKLILTMLIFNFIFLFHKKVVFCLLLSFFLLQQAGFNFPFFGILKLHQNQSNKTLNTWAHGARFK